MLVSCNNASFTKSLKFCKFCNLFTYCYFLLNTVMHLNVLFLFVWSFHHSQIPWFSLESHYCDRYENHLVLTLKNVAHIVLFCIKLLRIAWVNVLNLKINGADCNVIKNVMMQNIISFSFDFEVKWFTPHSDCTCTQVLDWCAAQWDYIMLRASLKVACGGRERDVNAGDSKLWWRVIYGRC